MRTDAHMLDVQPLTPRDNSDVRTLLCASWGSSIVAGHGVAYDASQLL